MTNMRIARAGGLAGFGALLLAGCGGGGGGGGDGGDGGSDGGTGGIDRGGITLAVGTITGFGSVHVNGVRYVTTGATFTIDDQPGSESDLRVGQVVRIEGTVNTDGTTGTATKVVFDDEAEGPIQSIDLVASRLVVVGRTVLVGPSTSFDDSIVPRSLEGLAVGARIEVSGFVTADGNVQATRIESKAAQGAVEVKGRVSALDMAARTFVLGSLTVSYATAQLEDFPSGQPANDDEVEVHGSIDGTGTLVATRVEHEGASSGGEDDDGDYEGLITRFVSPTDFDVAGQRVTTNASTAFEGGTAADLALNVAVEVEGGFDASGVLVASEVEFRHESDTEVEGRVEAVDVGAGTLTVLGITFRVTGVTRFEDHSSSDLDRFGLADIAVGDFVEVDGYEDATGFVATKVERDDADGDEVKLEGRAANVAPPDFTIGGVKVTTDANTEFRNDNGDSISSATFFAAAAGGAVVKARGALVGDTVLATRAELDD
jgi:hypothetical protein